MSNVLWKSIAAMLVLFGSAPFAPLGAFDWPAVLFSDQFETGDFFAWEYVQTQGGGVASMEKNVRHSGYYAGKFTLPTAPKEKSAYAVCKFKKCDTVNVHMRFSIGRDFDLGESGCLPIVILATQMDGSLKDIALVKDANGNFVIAVAENALPGARGKTAIAKQAWHRLECRYVTGNGTGELSVSIDGVQQYSNKNLTLPKRLEKIGVGCNEVPGVAAARGTIYVDDVIVDSKPIRQTTPGITLAYPDLNGRIGAKIIAILTGDGPRDKLSAVVTSTDGVKQTVFEKAGNLDKRVEFPLSLADFPKSTYTLTVRLLDDQGKQKAVSTIVYRKAYDGNPLFSIDADNNMIFKGKKFFPVTSFGLARGDIQEWKTTYANLLLGVDWDEERTGPDGYNHYLDVAYEHGMYCAGPMHDDRFDADEKPKITHDVIEEYVARFKDHPANAWWQFREEPDHWGYDAATVKRWWDCVKKNDPKRLTETVLMGYSYVDGGGVGETMKEYHWPHMTADIYGWDIYPVENEAKGYDFEKFALAQDYSVSWNMGLAPTMPFIQSADVSPGEDGGVPTFDEIQLMCWLMVVHGAKGIHWYPYSSELNEDNFAAMKKFAADAAALTGAILGAPSRMSVTPSLPSKGRIDVMTKAFDGKTYIFAANPKRLKQSVTFSLSAPGGATGVEVYGEKRSLPIKNAAFTDSFDPIKVHIYIVPFDPEKTADRKSKTTSKK